VLRAVVCAPGSACRTRESGNKWGGRYWVTVEGGRVLEGRQSCGRWRAMPPRCTTGACSGSRGAKLCPGGTHAFCPTSNGGGGGGGVGGCGGGGGGGRGCGGGVGVVVGGGGRCCCIHYQQCLVAGEGRYGGGGEMENKKVSEVSRPRPPAMSPTRVRQWSRPSLPPAPSVRRSCHTSRCQCSSAS